ncbi:podocalyxin-like protein 2 isoform X2 [Cyprinodon tularosa]|nr:podocalyxin-like protein 2 isoform X2 [Cyprinodon tularosa]
MSWPEIHETSRSQTRAESNSSTLNAPPRGNQEVARTLAPVGESQDVEDVMERMVHLAVPLDTENSRGDLEPTELHGGPASQEASGFDGLDTEDRERGEEEWERYAGEDRDRREDVTEVEDETGQGTDELSISEASEFNHTAPDLDTLIGYTSSFHPSKEPSRPFITEAHELEQQEQQEQKEQLEQPAPTVIQEKDVWKAEKDRDVQSSGYGVLSSSAPEGTAPPQTDTGTDFGLLGGDRNEDEGAGGSQAVVVTQNPTAPEVGSAPSREPLQPSLDQEEYWEEGEDMENDRKEREGIIPLTTDPSPTTGFTETEMDPGLEEPMQVVCLNWSELAGRGYVVLNMTKNMNCEEFRVCQGVQLLKIIEREFARRMNSPEGSWVLYLSKPTHQQHQLLMNLASGRGVIAAQEVLDMLGEIRTSLNKVGIQNYSAASSCQSRPSKTRSDYGKLFVVLVIIGSVCMVIITSGFIYICWQRRLPGVKSMFPAEELHSVKNGYHDNPTLDVTNESQAEMQEKKPSTNGLTGAGGGGGEDSGHWQAFVNQAATEDDEEEQDTHL